MTSGASVSARRSAVNLRADPMGPVGLPLGADGDVQTDFAFVSRWLHRRSREHQINTQDRHSKT